MAPPKGEPRRSRRDPTPAEIEKRCAAIQAEWTEEVRLSRASGLSLPEDRRKRKRRPHKRTRVREIRHKLHCPLAPDDVMIELFS